MKWEHKCDLAWLKMRQLHLTASDVKRLLPVTNTGRKRKVDEADYMKVMASKMRMLTEEDCMSYGAAARGHILEPYAISMLNNYLTYNHKPEHSITWWDDTLITRTVVGGNGSLAFSPDGLDISIENYNAGTNPRAMAEVKCYSDEHHLAAARTPKELLEERWQIATGMVVCESIERAYLVLFDPAMSPCERGFVIRFDRKDLIEEMEIIREIETHWLDFYGHYMYSRHYNRTTPTGAFQIGRYADDEEEICKRLEQKKALNPVV